MKRYSIALVLTVTLLSACATKPTSAVKINPTADFLDCVADEYEANIHGECTKEVVKDWLTVVE